MGTTSVDSAEGAEKTTRHPRAACSRVGWIADTVTVQGTAWVTKDYHDTWKSEPRDDTDNVAVDDARMIVPIPNP
jgi:hypothetical protein